MGKAIFLVVVAMAVILVCLWIGVERLHEQATARRRAAEDRATIDRRRWLAQRTTDAERHLATAALADAYARGQLTLAEHDERVAAVLRAMTNADVQHQLRGLGDTDRP